MFIRPRITRDFPDSASVAAIYRFLAMDALYTIDNFPFGGAKI
jgi:hypothetical protein